MKHVRSYVLGLLIAVSAVSGCSTQASAPQGPKPTTEMATVAPAITSPATPLPADSGRTVERTPEQIGQLILVWVAGYCEGWSKATGENFEQCFDNTVEDTLHQYKANTGVDLDLRTGK